MFHIYEKEIQAIPKAAQNSHKSEKSFWNLGFHYVKPTENFKRIMQSGRLWENQLEKRAAFNLFIKRIPQNIAFTICESSTSCGFREVRFSQVSSQILAFDPPNGKENKHLCQPMPNFPLWIYTIIHIGGFCKRKKRIFFQFYFNQQILCILFYVNLCIFPDSCYVDFTKSGMYKDTHGLPRVYPLHEYSEKSG